MKASFRDDRGRTGEFRLAVPEGASPSAPAGMLLYLHGDGGADMEWYWESVKAAAAKKGLIALSVQTPPSAPGSGCGAANARCWWSAAPQNARFLNALLENLSNTYGLDKSRVVFSGASGGATFLGSYFIPKYGKDYQGGALLACPGRLTSLSTEGIAAGPKPDNFKMRIWSSSADYLRGMASSLPGDYRKHGYHDTKYFEAQGAHCQFGRQTPADLLAAMVNETLPDKLTASTVRNMPRSFFVSTLSSAARDTEAPPSSGTTATATPATQPPPRSTASVEQPKGMPIRFSNGIWHYFEDPSLARYAVYRNQRVPPGTVGYYIDPWGQFRFAVRSTPRPA
jgi:hypothetical protein